MNALFFDKRYDLARVGRYKFNKKLALKNRIAGQVADAAVVSPVTGEILAEEGETIGREAAQAIQNAGVNAVWVRVGEQRVKVVGNNFADASAFLRRPMQGSTSTSTSRRCLRSSPRWRAWTTRRRRRSCTSTIMT